MIETNQFSTQVAPKLGSGDSNAQFFGMAIWGVVLVALIQKCFSISRRPEANSKCAKSLGILLSGFFLLFLLAVARHFQIGLTILPPVLGFGMIAAFVVAIVQAIMGLIEYHRKKGEQSQGRVQAYWTLGLGASMLCLMAYGFMRGRQSAIGVQSKQPGAGEVLSFDELNFSIRNPGRPWVQMDAKKLNQIATVAFMRTKPQAYFMVIAERMGMGSDFSAKDLSNLSTANLRSTDDAARVVSEEALRRQGLEGIQTDTDATVRGYHMLYRHWGCATNGYAYQLVSWGRIEDAPAIRIHSEELFAAFNLIDRERKALAPGPQAADFHSPLFDYTVKMADSGLHPSATMAKSFPSAEYTAIDQSGNLGLFIVPICLMGQSPEPEALALALADMIGVSYPGPEIRDEKPIVDGDISGIEFGCSKPISEGILDYRIKVLKVREWAFLLGVDALRKPGVDGNRLEETLARVKISAQNPPPTNIIQRFTQQDLLRHGFVFNEVGLFHHKSRQYAKSAAYFKTAFEFERKSGVYLLNVINALTDDGRRAEALKYIEDNAAAAATNLPVRAAQAFLQSQLEEVDKAITNYATLFEDGYRSDDYLAEYAALLNQTGQSSTALETVEKYLKVSDTPAVRLIEARLLKQRKEYAKAIDLLLIQTKKYSYNTDLAISLADAYNQSSLFPEALAVSQKLIDRQSDWATAYYLRGCAEFGLKRYREAKISFEEVLKKSPASADAKSYLELVSGMLGEGNNSAVKDPIAAVTVPEAILKLMPPEAPVSFVKDFGAHYVRQITAISFTKKKDFRRTDHMVIKIRDSSGVAGFSTMQFGFDPLSEAIYVNDLKVTDAEGKVVATGKVSDYYVVDGASSEIVSQKKILNIPISGLSPGSVIDLTVTRRDLSPPAEFPFTTHSTLSSFPILQDTFFIRGDTNGLRFEGLGLDPTPKTEDGLCWFQNQPEVYKYEPFAQSPSDYGPTLYVGDATASWEVEARKYLTNLTEYLKLENSSRDLAASLTAKSAKDAQKIHALAHYVQTNFTYKALEFGRRARIPHLTTETLHNRYGDCKDHSVLLQQMLTAAGIPARLALIRTQGSLQKNIPSLDQFNHMVVYLPEFQNGFFLDCTDKGSNLSQAVPSGLGGREALILDAANPRFVRIPEYPNGSSTITSFRDIRITNTTDLVVHERLTFKGFHGGGMRAYFKEVQPAARRSYIEAQLVRLSGQLTGFKVENLEDTQAPLVFDMDYLIKNQFHLSGTQLVGKLPCLWEQTYSPIDSSEKRVTPFELTFPLEFESTILLATPNGYKEPVEGAFRRSANTPFATSQSDAKKEGSSLRITYGFKRKSGKFPTSEYNKYRDNITDAFYTLEQLIAFTKKP